MITETERRTRLAILLSEGIGRKLFITLISQFGNAQDILGLGRLAWQHAGLSEQQIQGLQQPAWDLADIQLAWQAKAPNHKLLFWDEENYPKNLRNVADFPPLLWVRGQHQCLQEPQLAIVGSRHATRSGLSMAFEFARDLAKDGLTITSGLAGGIDTAAHEGALAHSFGSTIAVMGTGIDLMYPAKNKQLALEVVERGVIVSEFPVGTRAQAWHFPQRNRIISGLSLGVLVVEATEASGSLITARLALEQGREVFAIPGSIHNPLAKGCHLLIKRGQAKLTETVSDILLELSGQLQRFLQAPTKTTSLEDFTKNPNKHEKIDFLPLEDPSIDLTNEAKQLLKYIGFEPLLMDELLLVSGFSPAQASSLLIELEMSGSVNLYGGGKVARKR